MEPFLKVQQRLQADNLDDQYRVDEYLLVSEFNNLLDIVFNSWGETVFDEFLNVLCQADVAKRLRTLKIGAQDFDGANGTRDWDFTKLVESDATFPNLLSLAIETYNNVEHNRPIISSSIGGFDYAEKGTLAKWLTKSPNLRFLSTPSAPDEMFFKRERHPLEYLVVQAGYATENFILNFSQSDCFPNLQRLDYTDYDERYMEDYRQDCTPLEHFEQLFRSKAFAPVEAFTWCDPIFTSSQLVSLKSLRPDLWFVVTHSSIEHVES